MSREAFYITCAIDYVNSNPHLGTAYEKIAADALARYRRMAGADVYFLMGTDEHSLNVERAALKAGKTPLAYTDEMAARFEEVWKSLNISYDVFIRTSEPRHHRAVRALPAHPRAPRHREGIYKLYCVSCGPSSRRKAGGRPLSHPSLEAGVDRTGSSGSPPARHPGTLPAPVSGARRN
jgi:methionyl-tRNA synthetase